jgi:hypothetical protein
MRGQDAAGGALLGPRFLHGPFVFCGLFPGALKIVLRTLFLGLAQTFAEAQGVPRGQ